MQRNRCNNFAQFRNGLMSAALLLACSTWIIAGCASGTGAESDQVEWTVLFDGESTEHWRGFRQDVFPLDAWTVEEDALKPLTEGEVIDLITRETYENFELELEWRAAANGNAGIFFMVTEEHPEVWYTGPEIQILDDENHPDGEDPITSAGSIFDLIAPAEEKPLNPAGEWNHARLRIEDGRVQHWLNGVKILDFDVFGEEFRSLVADSKFAEMPDFAQSRRGYIALQHASVSPLKAEVWYRNVRVRELE